ncbi:MAG: hypothetical protein ACXVDV_20905, partial [Bacteroidia bacterium]
MKKNKVYTVAIMLMFSADLAFAQASKMTIEQAVEIALKSNYDISIAENLGKEAENNNTLGNAGMLPTAAINASGTLANNATKQEFSTGASVDRSGVRSKNITSGLYLT